MKPAHTHAPLLDQVSARVRRGMARYGLSSKELAVALGVSRNIVDRWLRGEVLPSLPNYLAMKALFAERARQAEAQTQ